MSDENLQTIIISKKIAADIDTAKSIASQYGRRLSPSRESSLSWEFRQSPANKFSAGSFKSFPIEDEPGIVLVYGKLKLTKNPMQKTFAFDTGSPRDSVMEDWNFWFGLEPKIKRIRNEAGLIRVVSSIENRGVDTDIVKCLIVSAIADRARSLKLAHSTSSIGANEKIYKKLKSKRTENPAKPKSKSKSKSKPKKIYKKLSSPKAMPDPGPMAWLGSLVEFAWEMRPGESSAKVDDKGNALWEPSSEWMFMWSPRYKAVVSIRLPRNMYKRAKVDRHGGAAKMFERFMARPAENTFELKVPDVKLYKAGKKAAHIVYRSDKWSPKRLKSDYIHPFEKGVQLYCGPSVENPDVFICFGGKLTLTERGLVW